MIFLLIGLFMGIVTTWVAEKIVLSNKRLKKNIWDNPRTFYGYHIHHSLFGLIAVTFGLFFILISDQFGFFLIGFGIGVIIIHTKSDGRLVFVEKM